MDGRFEGELNGAIDGDKVRFATVLPVGGQRLHVRVLRPRQRRSACPETRSWRIRPREVDRKASHVSLNPRLIPFV